MADGINVESNIEQLSNLAIDDTSLQNVFASGSVGDVLAKFGQTLQGDLKNSLDEKGTNVTSNLYQSITFNVEVFANTFEFSLSMANYWSYVDEGRGAGGDPKKLYPQFLKWARTKKAFGGLPQVPDDQINSFAFNTARKVTRFGFKGNNFYSDVIEDGRLEKLQNDLSEAAKDDITSLIFRT